MSVQIGNVLTLGKQTFDDINKKYYASTLPEYFFTEVKALPDSNYKAQTCAPLRIVMVWLDMFPHDEMGVDPGFVWKVFAHESIHAKLFEDRNQDWPNCGSEAFKKWEKIIGI